MSLKSYTVTFTFDDEKPGDMRALEVLNNETVECALAAFRAGRHEDFSLEDGIKYLFYKALARELTRRLL